MFHLACINLPNDTDRKQFMLSQFNELGLDFLFISSPRPFEGYAANNYQYAGEQGALRSHLKAITSFIGYDDNPVVILEDDVILDPQFKFKLKAFLTDPPPKWDLLYLGGAPRAKVIESEYPRVSMVTEFTQACGYVLPADALRAFICFAFDRMGEKFPNACYDNILNDFILLNKKIAYAFDPPIVYQAPGFSTLRQGPRNYVDFTNQQWSIYKK